MKFRIVTITFIITCLMFTLFASNSGNGYDDHHLSVIAASQDSIAEDSVTESSVTDILLDLGKSDQIDLPQTIQLPFPKHYFP